MKERGQGSPDNQSPTSQGSNQPKEQGKPADPKEALKALERYFETITPEQYFDDVRRFSGSGKCLLDYIREEEDKLNKKPDPSNK